MWMTFEWSSTSTSLMIPRLVSSLRLLLLLCLRSSLSLIVFANLLELPVTRRYPPNRTNRTCRQERCCRILLRGREKWKDGEGYYGHSQPNWSGGAERTSQCCDDVWWDGWWSRWRTWSGRWTKVLNIKFQRRRTRSNY